MTTTNAPILAAATAPIVAELVTVSMSTDCLVHTAECASQHFAPWMIEEQWFCAAVDAVNNGTMQPKAMDDDEDQRPKKPPYAVLGGTAIIPIAGPIMKKASKYGGTSSIEVRSAIRKAIHDESIQSILLHIDSPGGTVAGTADLAADVRAADGHKPVYAHIEDLGASAAYWVASQARRVTCNSTGRVGSIGTLLVLADTSGAYAARGIKVHVISTGKYKGAGADGAPITDAHLKMFQEGVDDLNEHFLNGVSEGRKMSMSQVREIADGRVHIASKAKEMGLIDAVTSLEEVITHIRKDELQRLEAAVLPQPNQQVNAPEASGRTDAPPAISKETSLMANESTQAAPALTPAAVSQGSNIPQGAPVSEVGRLNQQAIQGYIDQGRKLGHAEGVQAAEARMRDIVAACPGRFDIAVNSFLAGQNAQTVALIHNAAQTEAANARQKHSELEVENARLQALIATGGHSGVGMAVSPGFDQATNLPEGLEPEAQAKLEWDSNPLTRAQNNNNEKAWTLYRVNQLKGNVNILKRN